MSISSSDQYWMAEAIKLASKGLYSSHPNPRVGCVIVKQNRMVSSGWHEYAGGPHAETNALIEREGETGGDVYITLEPCSHHGRTPPCVDALIEHKPDRVIVAMQDPNPLVAGNGVQKLKDANIEVIVGILENEARQLNCGFVKRFDRKKPFVRMKMATSLDGRTALKNGYSQWISGESSRRDVQFLRARSSAILTSAATVIADDPQLDVRISKEDLGQTCEVRQPVRVVIDSRLILTGKEKIFKQGDPVWIYTVSDELPKHRKILAAGADVIVIDSSPEGRVDLGLLLKDLATREINEVHTECGQTLAGALLEQKLVDELVIYMAPVLLGSQARGAFDIGELTEMNSRISCKIQQLRQTGDDLRLTLIPEYS
ncbi:MAG: bifunctional diaminohydroxyphosphoribosylaminopyrimidine deaminase/5-amino-6-(5-phosphoribosylamino)uracil reductase RibD [Gammaproteobacteria bacterium]|nr:bifunctional diaminohydroxyphosphoribosylaminopyrimidine deaminase/5-amino-6-(5-phosphoribosylamino)uracil reductase RibD [Gammaproteobacteria bacterium]